MLLLGLLAMACAGTSANPLRGTALDPGAVYFVENHGEDELHRKIHLLGFIPISGSQFLE
jgi:hypothetical protein